MSDDATQQKHEPTHLPVLPHSGKVEELRREAMADQKAQPQTQDRVANAALPAEGAPASAPVPVEDKLLEGKIIAALKTVYDPEIPVDIYSTFTNWG
jgi:hypothetical protein